jgi:hypothetical protein
MLQIFIENAIKHGIKPLPSKQKGRLTIRFYFDAKDANLLICSVENNGLSLEAAQEVKAKMVALEQVGRQKSRGLDITQRRIAALNTKNGWTIQSSRRHRNSSAFDCATTLSENINYEKKLPFYSLFFVASFWTMPISNRASCTDRTSAILGYYCRINTNIRSHRR